MVERLGTLGARDLSQETFPPIGWFVENLLGPGCYLLASLPKKGKGFFVLGLGLAVTEGKPFMDSFPSNRTGVCILGLEDRFRRLQSRLWRMSDEPSNDLRLAEQSERLDSGLIEQLREDLRNHPETGIYVVDTYAAVRTPGADYGYQTDYDDLALFTDFAEANGICVVVCHHCRKGIDPTDPFLSISGTTGLVGAVTGMIVIHDDPRCAKGECIMSVQGKDVERSHYRIVLEDCIWRLLEPLSETQVIGRAVPDCVEQTLDFMTGCGGPWHGSASDLLLAARIEGVRPDVYGKYLAQYRDYLASCGVAYERRHTRIGNVLSLELIQ